MSRAPEGAAATPHALVGAWGAAVAMFDRFAVAAGRLGARLDEQTAATSRVRIGRVGRPAAVLQDHAHGSRRLVALGSGLLTHGATDLAARMSRPDDAWLLDALPDDVVALLADERTESLSIAGAAGNHRVYVAEVEGGALVSTQLGLLAAALGDALRVDRSSEDFLLGFGFVPGTRTVYDGVMVHPAGTLRRWGAPAAEPPPVSPVSPATPPEAPSDAVHARRALHDAFFEALESQAGARRRHAVLLGGFDSALVVAGLRQLGHEVETYTFAFGDARYEQRHAEEIATQLGARHHRVPITPEIVGHALESFADVMSQPSAQPHYQLHTTHASQIIAADGHDHVFTGDGCDAVFLGYPTVSRRAHLVDRLAALPHGVRGAMLRLTSARMVERRLGHVARVARSTLGSLALPWPARGHLPTRYLDDAALRRLRRDRPPQRESVDQVRLRLAAGLEGLDPVRLAFHGNALTGQSRAKVEGSVATSGVAQFSPYLHPRVKGLAASLPLERLRPAGAAAGAPGKALLIDMVRERRLLPDYVIDMPKQSPSDSPIDAWYAGPLRPLVHRMLGGLPFEYDRAYVDEMLARKRSEDWFRERVSISHHALQAIGLLCSYAAFTVRAR